jgi:nucleoside-diphosphate-sugar epimerase
MKVLILGTGYLGSHAAQRFKELGYHVTGTTRSKEKVSHVLKSCNDYLLWNQETPSEFLNGFEILLFSAAPDQTTPYDDVYLKNSLRIKKAAEASPTLKQIIYTGSTSVYGDHQGALVTEETALKPANDSQRILCETEEVLRSIKSCSVCIFRLGELIGPGRNLVERLDKMRGRSFPGTGDSITNFSPLEDVINAIVFAVEHSLNGTFNLVNDLHIKRKELYRQIADQQGWPVPTWDSTLSSPHGGNRIVNSDKIKALGLNLNNHT